MSDQGTKVPTAGIALAAVLEEGGEVAETIRRRVHRSQIWRYTTGRGQPDADTIAFLHRMTDGRIAADGWALDEEGLETTAA